MRPHIRRTELGDRMYPVLRQCYEAALSARSLATSVRSGEVGSLRLALSRTIDLAALVAHIVELRRVFSRLELKLLRGSGSEVAEMLRQGQAELAVASDLGETWERLDRWPLFEEDFLLGVNSAHPLARQPRVQLAALKNELLLLRSYCENVESVHALLRGGGLDVGHGYELTSDRDVMVLLEANVGIAFVPRSTPVSSVIKRTAVDGLGLCRTVYVYAVAGRQRTTVGATMLKMLRGADWSGVVDGSAKRSAGAAVS
jgi:DNA-binding transcriptional LysR family regulator